MGTTRSALQVGILVFLAAVLFGAGYIFFEHDRIGTNSYLVTMTFTNAEGIRAGSEIEYSGVLVGHVDSVSLAPDGVAVIRSRMNRGIKIPTDALITIDSSLLGSSSTVEILPPSSKRTQPEAYVAEGGTIAGQNGLSFATLQGQAGQTMQKAGYLMDDLRVTTRNANTLLEQMTQTAKTADKLVSDPMIQQGLRGTVENINLASGQALDMTHDLRSMMYADNHMLQGSLNNVDATSGEFRSIAADNKAKINNMIANLNDTTTQVSEMVTKSNLLLDQTSDTLTKGHVTENITDTMQNLKSATDKLNLIADDLHGLTGDPAVQSDLKTTIHNVAQASGHTNELISRLDSLAGGHKSPALNIQTQLVFWQNFRSNNFRTDFDLYAPFDQNDFVRAGFRDLTESNRLNLQYGQRYNDRASLRAGIYDGKVGLGADYDLFGRDATTLDLYDPNQFKLDVRQRFGIGKNDNTALWLGMENIPRSPGVAAGFEIRR